MLFSDTRQRISIIYDTNKIQSYSCNEDTPNFIEKKDNRLVVYPKCGNHEQSTSWELSVHFQKYQIEGCIVSDASNNDGVYNSNNNQYMVSEKILAPRNKVSVPGVKTLFLFRERGSHVKVRLENMSFPDLEELYIFSNYAISKCDFPKLHKMYVYTNLDINETTCPSLTKVVRYNRQGRIRCFEEHEIFCNEPSRKFDMTTDIFGDGNPFPDLSKVTSIALYSGDTTLISFFIGEKNYEGFVKDQSLVTDRMNTELVNLEDIRLSLGYGTNSRIFHCLLKKICELIVLPFSLFLSDDKVDDRTNVQEFNLGNYGRLTSLCEKLFIRDIRFNDFVEDFNLSDNNITSLTISNVIGTVTIDDNFKSLENLDVVINDMRSSINLSENLNIKRFRYMNRYSKTNKLYLNLPYLEKLELWLIDTVSGINNSPCLKSFRIEILCYDDEIPEVFDTLEELYIHITFDESRDKTWKISELIENSTSLRRLCIPYFLVQTMGSNLEYLEIFIRDNMCVDLSNPVFNYIEEIIVTRYNIEYSSNVVNIKNKPMTRKKRVSQISD